MKLFIIFILFLSQISQAAVPYPIPTKKGGTGATALGSGILYSDSVGTVVRAGADGTTLTNVGISTSVAANALTITLTGSNGSAPSSTNQVVVGFRNSTVTTGAPVIRTATAATSLVISSGSTLGHVSARTEPIYVYLMDNSGTLELAVSTMNRFEIGSVVTSTAEGGAGAADSRSTLYSTTARTNISIRLIGLLQSNQATAGTWASQMSVVSILTFPKGGLIEVNGPYLARKNNSSNTAYLRDISGNQSYPLVVSADPTTNSLMIVRGGGTTVPSGASCGTAIGEGYSCSRFSTGQYNVTFTDSFADIPACTCNRQDNIGYCAVAFLTASTVSFITASTAASNVDSTWTFNCIGSRPN